MTRRLDDRSGDLRGKRVLVRSDLTSRSTDGRITDDGRIRASVPTIRQLADAGARVVVTAHLGRPKGAPGPAVLPAPGRGPARRAARRRRRVRRGHRRRLRPGHRRRRSRTARSPCWRTSGSTRARPARTTPSAARSPTSSPRSADVFVSDGFGVVHRKQASRVRRRAAAAARHGRPGRRPRSTCCAGSPRTPSGPTSWCSAARRSPTSSASSTTCSARPTSC